MSKPLKVSEHKLQAEIVHWFRLQYPKLNLIAIPNGQWIALSGIRKYALINKYKAEGMTAGVSDLFLAHSDGKYHGLWLEVKSEGKKPTDEQIGWLNKMTLAGYWARWTDDFEHAKIIIEDYIRGWYK